MFYDIVYLFVYKFRLAYAVSCDSFKSAMPMLEFYYAVRPEMQNNRPLLVIVVVWGNDISIARTCTDVDRSFH